MNLASGALLLTSGGINLASNALLLTSGGVNSASGGVNLASGALLSTSGALLSTSGALLSTSGALLSTSGALLSTSGALLLASGALHPTSCDKHFSSTRPNPVRPLTIPMKPTLFLLTALCGATLAHAVPTPIAGTVRDGTGGDRPLPGANVQLIRPGDKGDNKVVATTRTDGAGRFQFPAREWGADSLLMASVPHQGYDYLAVAYDGGNKLQKVGMNVNPSKVDVQTFDTTTKNVPLQFQVHHLAINSTDTGLHVIERIVVVNPSQKTFLGIGPRKISILLNVPKGAKDIALDPKITDAKMIQTSSGWGIERPITPQAYGSRNAIIFSYNMDWPSKLPWAKRIDLSRETSYPTQFFFVARLPDDKNLEVEAPLLGQATQTELPIGDKTETRIVNSIGAPQMPGMPGGEKNDPVVPADKMMKVVIARPVNPLFWAFTAMTIGLCVFLPVAMIKPRRDKTAGVASDKSTLKSAEPRAGKRVKLPASSPVTVDASVGANGNGVALSTEARALVAQIAQLDDEHEAGRIADADYQAQRAAWKEALIQTLDH